LSSLRLTQDAFNRLVLDLSGFAPADRSAGPATGANGIASEADKEREKEEKIKRKAYVPNHSSSLTY
jgi:hypothetical protein